jgi:serine/threonine-protein kinase
VGSWSSVPQEPPSVALRLPPVPAVRMPGPAQPVEVELLIQSTPKDVEVYLGGEKVGTSASPIKIKRGDKPLNLTLKASGFSSADIEITPSANIVVPAKLVKLRTKRAEVEF